MNNIKCRPLLSLSMTLEYEDPNETILDYVECTTAVTTSWTASTVSIFKVFSEISTSSNNCL